MGSVLYVTDQVPSSHSKGGALNNGEEWEYLRGERREIVEGADVARGWELGAGAGGIESAIVVLVGWLTS